MADVNCNVCGSALDRPVYESERSLTSLCDIFPETTRVRLCDSCGHLQTDEISDAGSFYDEDYTILVNSEEEDQIYEVRDGEPVYRTAHQVTTLLDRLGPPQGAKLLDYGCAKSSTIRALHALRPDIDPYLFDVSDRYIGFWEKFVAPGHWATYHTPPEWAGTFDIVTSFFSMEHMVSPGQSVRDVSELLCTGGILYGIVPNVLTNIADFLVIDHVNHFTRSSLTRLLESAGLEVVDIDADSHRGAFVFMARKTSPPVKPVAASPVREELDRLAEIAAFWQDAAGRLREYESSHAAAGGDVAVYGAGFYGAFLRSWLKAPERICCILDQNPFLQGSDVGGVPVIPPDRLPGSVQTMLVGLNPAHARDIIADIPALSGRELDCFYL